MLNTLCFGGDPGILRRHALDEPVGLFYPVSLTSTIPEMPAGQRFALGALAPSYQAVQRAHRARRHETSMSQASG
jgi:hypothetical protein